MEILLELENLIHSSLRIGETVTQVSKEEFVKISHDYAIAAAKLSKTESPGAAFHYISGKGTRAESRTFRSKVDAVGERPYTPH